MSPTEATLARILSPMQREALFSAGYRIVRREAVADGTEMNDVIRGVMAEWGIDLADLVGPSKIRPHARPRQVAFLLASKRLKYSMAQIGAAFGGRDHSTVAHGISMIEGLSAESPDFAARVDRARQIAAKLTAERRRSAA